jgi:hypothetical protein
MPTEAWRKKSIAISIANIVIEIGQQHQEGCMVILKNGIKSVTDFFSERTLKKRDIWNKFGTPGLSREKRNEWEPCCPKSVRKITKNKNTHRKTFDKYRLYHEFQNN